MSIITRLESALSLTRGDVTIALFVACAALFGFFYLTLADDRMPERERLELLRLQKKYDSLLASRDRTALSRFYRDASSDSLPSVQSVLSESAAKEAPRTESRTSTRPTSPVNLNSASISDLESLPGIGEKTAEAIIERRKHIPFRRAEDLMEVKGIGEKKFAKIKPFVKVR